MQLKIALVTKTSSTKLIKDLHARLSKFLNVSSSYIESNKDVSEIVLLRQVRSMHIAIVHPVYQRVSTLQDYAGSLILTSGAYSTVHMHSENVFSVPAGIISELLLELVDELAQISEGDRCTINHVVHELLCSKVVVTPQEIETEKPVGEEQRTGGMTPPQFERHKRYLEETGHSNANKWGSTVLAKLMLANGYFESETFDSLYKQLEKASDVRDEKHSLATLQCPLFKCDVRNDKPLWPDSRVLFVDDQHERGWSTLLAHMIHGNANCLIRKPFLHDILEDDYQRKPGFFAASGWDSTRRIRESVSVHRAETAIQFHRNFPFDLVLLDYRILEMEEEAAHPNEISGARLAQEIRDFDPSVPIIGISASERTRNYKSMQPTLYFFEKPKPIGESEDVSLPVEESFRGLEEAIILAKKNQWIRAANGLLNAVDMQKYHKEIKGRYLKHYKDYVRMAKSCLVELVHSMNNGNLGENDSIGSIKEIVDVIIDETNNLHKGNKLRYTATDHFLFIYHLFRVRDSLTHSPKLYPHLDSCSHFTLALLCELIGSFIYIDPILIAEISSYLSNTLQITSCMEFNTSLQKVLLSRTRNASDMFEQQLSNERPYDSKNKTMAEMFIEKARMMSTCLGIEHKKRNEFTHRMSECSSSSDNAEWVINRCTGKNSVMDATWLLASTRHTNINNSTGLLLACFASEQYALSVFLSNPGHSSDKAPMHELVGRLLNSSASIMAEAALHC